tara:strand:- start:13207 stop:13938 length:732 start_codon:yes stop_codon:yes gene_type:complete
MTQQKVLITGATSGIGKQLALDYDKAGWHVIACGRNQEKLAQLKEDAPEITCLKFDITRESQTRDAIGQLKVIPDLWIFNAGDCEYIEEGVMDVALFDRVMKINLYGLAHCIAASQVHFKAGQHVAIVTSIAGEVALPRAEVYGASKAAVTYLGHCIRIPLERKGLYVSLIFPGFVQTPLTDRNTFPMPMRVDCDFASRKIRRGLAKKKRDIYFPFLFTGFLRLIALLPYPWQHKLVSYFIST